MQEDKKETSYDISHHSSIHNKKHIQIQFKTTSPHKGSPKHHKILVKKTNENIVAILKEIVRIWVARAVIANLGMVISKGNVITPSRLGIGGTWSFFSSTNLII